MDISVTQFKQRCLELIRHVERTGEPVVITRRGRTVAQLRRPTTLAQGAAQRPWERLRAAGGRLLAEPEETVLTEEAFEALR